MQPNALSCHYRRQADSRCGHIKISVIAALVLTLFFGSVATVDALQQGLPKFKPPVKKAKPIKPTDPFENYEGQQVDSKSAETKPVQDAVPAADPFESYEDASASKSNTAAASDPFENYEGGEKQDAVKSDAANSTPNSATTVSKKPATPPQNFGSNDLRSRSSSQTPPANQVTVAPKRSGLPPIRSTPRSATQAVPPAHTGSLPPMRLARPTAPKQIQSEAMPPVQAAPLQRARNVLPLTVRPRAQAQSQPLVRQDPAKQGSSVTQGSPLVRRSMDTLPKNDKVIVDPNLAPATFNAPLNATSSPKTEPTVKPAAPMTSRTAIAPKKNVLPPLNIPKNPNVQVAKTLLAELRASEHSMPSEGSPLSLVDALAKVSNSNRKPVIQQYWKTYGTWAEYRFAIDEMQWLQQLNPSGSQSDRALLEAARAAAKDSVKAKQIILEREQRRLNRYVYGKGKKGMPLPSDNPLVFRYRTQFDLYSTKKTMPEELRVLNLRLPKRYQLIGNRSATVQKCRAAVMQASREMGGNQPASSLLLAMTLSREAHSAFVQTVVWYNQDITEYALSVKPYENTPEEVVAMLIPLKSKQANPGNGTGLRQAQLPPSNFSRGTQPPRAAQPMTNRPTDTSGDFGSGSARTPGGFGGSLPNRQPPSAGTVVPQNPAVSPNGFKARSSLPPMRGTGNSSLPNKTPGGFRR